MGSVEIIKKDNKLVKSGEDVYSKILAGLDPSTISLHERRLAVLYLMGRNIFKSDLMPSDIQKIFKVSYQTAINDAKFAREKICEYVGVGSIIDFINGFITRKMNDRNRALKSGNISLATGIDDSLFDRLEKVGMLGEHKEPLAHEINVTNYNLMNENELRDRLNKAIERAREYQQLLAGSTS